ncbi:MAG: glycosyltransferase [Planctomycetota bacterium]
MRVLHLIDEAFAARESDLLDRLEIGLVDEGVRLFRAGPARADEDDAATPNLYRRSIGFPPATPWTTRRRRARWLHERLESIESVRDGAVVDVVHAFGGRVWDLAIEFGRRIGRPVALEVWRARLAHRASSLGSARSGSELLLSAPDETIERELLAAGLTAPVRMAPWGVHAPARCPEPRPSRGARSVLIAGGGREASTMRDCVRALASLDAEDVMVFIDASAFHRAQLWPVVEGAGMLQRVTLVDQLEALRDLALQADVIVQPEALGEQRSILLDAMAHGVRVVAQRDERVSWLIDGRTAWLAGMTDVDGWVSTLRYALHDDEHSRRVVESAWSYVREHRLASRHVAAVLDLYEWAAEAPTLPIRDG